MANINSWYVSFLNRQPTAEEDQYWQNAVNKQGQNAALDQFLSQAKQARPDLTDYQTKVWNQAADQLKADPMQNDLYKRVTASGDTSLQTFLNDVLSPDTGGNVSDDQRKEAAKITDLYNKGGPAAMAQYYKDAGDNNVLSTMQVANTARRANGVQDGGALGFIKDALPVAAFVFGGGMLGQALVGGAAAGGVAGAGGAAAGGTAAGAGGAAAGAGGAAAGAGGAAAGAGGLSSAWSALPAYLQQGLTSAAVKAGTNVVTGQPLTSGVLQSGLMGGLGSVASTATGNFIGNGLTNLGLDPSTVKNLAAPISTGVMTTGKDLLSGKGLGNSLLNGIENGTISYAGQGINNLLKDSGMSDPAANIVGGAGKGAVSSAIKGGNILSGAVGGATQGAVKSGASYLGSSNTQPTSGIAMSDSDNDNDYGAFDGKNWLNDVENDYSDPTGFNTALQGGLLSGDYDPTTLGSTNNNSITDYLNQYGFLDQNKSDGENTGLSSFLNGLGSSAGSGTSSIVDKLLQQLKGAGSKASENPLGALAALIGAGGTLKNAISGSPNNLASVDKLFQSGNAAANAPATNLPQFNAVVGKNPAWYTQQYNADGSKVNQNVFNSGAPPAPTQGNMDYDSILNNMYQNVFHRAPDQGGEQFWTNAMKSGVTPSHILQELQNSPEAQGSATAPAPAQSNIIQGGLSGVRA